LRSKLPLAGEPRKQYAPGVGLEKRYAAKAAELGKDPRTIKRWVAAYLEHAEAGLAPCTARGYAAAGDSARHHGMLPWLLSMIGVPGPVSVLVSLA
jgi:hypothetical protein